MKEFNYLGVAIDPEQLYSEQEIYAKMFYGGPSDKTMGNIRNRYKEAFGRDLVCVYPFPIFGHIGAIIVPVREGFCMVPYDEVHKDLGVVYNVEAAQLIEVELIEDMVYMLVSQNELIGGALKDVMNTLAAGKGITHQAGDATDAVYYDELVQLLADNDLDETDAHAVAEAIIDLVDSKDAYGKDWRNANADG